MGRLEEALECALTYLLFHEGEEFVTENVEYYREELGHNGKPREVSDRSWRCCASHAELVLSGNTKVYCNSNVKLFTSYQRLIHDLTAHTAWFKLNPSHVNLSVSTQDSLGNDPCVIRRY